MYAMEIVWKIVNKLSYYNNIYRWILILEKNIQLFDGSFLQ